ncbi:hypothetical protein B0T14DRAFT_284943 [Immersiella caudata]|uniref:Uncharacterized protein n=1 Tax=Immersiella caudata TaxID=314043 RepID=A0AA40BU70_9PEZI|nr:hypothetical protein B0T14DRAFT_284943 [Immersiella caudata]
MAVFVKLLECSACGLDKPANAAFSKSQRRANTNKCISCVDVHHRFGVDGITFPDPDEDGNIDFMQTNMDYMKTQWIDVASIHDWDFGNKEKMIGFVHRSWEHNLGRADHWISKLSRAEFDLKLMTRLDRIEGEKIPDWTDDEWEMVAPLNKNPDICFQDPEDISMAQLDAEEYRQSDEYKKLQKDWKELAEDMPVKPAKAAAAADKNTWAAPRPSTPIAAPGAIAAAPLSPPETPPSPMVSTHSVAATVNTVDEDDWMMVATKASKKISKKYTESNQMANSSGARSKGGNAWGKDTGRNRELMFGPNMRG